MIVGSWGPIVFGILPRVIPVGGGLITEVTQTALGRWTEHETVNTVPISEFLGPGKRETQLKCVFSTALGLIPAAAFALMRELIERGMHFPLIIGGAPLSLKTWYAEELIGTGTDFTPRLGVITWMEVDVMFKEYR